MVRNSSVRRGSLFFIALLSVLTIAAVPVSAQSFDYTGVVHYENGTPAEGANVTVEQYDSSFSKVGESSNISNATGHFNVSDISKENSYKAKVTLNNSDGNVTHTSKSAPTLPYSIFSTLGDVNYFLRPAVTLNVTAYDPSSTRTQANNGTPFDLPNLDTGLEVLTDVDGKPYVYKNASGNLTKVDTQGNVIGNSTNTIPNVSGATALAYNGSGGYYAANSTDLVKFKNDTTSDYNLTQVNNWSLSDQNYNDTHGLETRNESGHEYVYLSVEDESGYGKLDKLNTSNNTITRETENGRQQAKIEYHNGNWYMARNASSFFASETWEVLKLNSSFNTSRTWELPQDEEVRGFENHPSSGWVFDSINTGDDKGRGRTLTLPDPTVKSFTYQVKDTKLGYPVASKFSGSVEQESIVLPANRDYGLEMHPTGSMPTSKAVKNIKQNESWKQNNKMDVRLNVSEQPKWIEGYANTSNTSMGSPGFDNFTVIPFLLETGKNGVPMTFKQDPHQFPRNLSVVRSGSEADNFTASEGYYNITQIGSAETSRVLLFYTAYNASEDQYYGGFSNISLTATQDDVTGLNVTLEPLVGKPGNMTTQVFDSNFNLNNVDEPTSLRNFTVQNETGSPRSAFVEARVNYSSTFSNLDTAFTWVTNVGNDGNFSIPILNRSIEEAIAYPSGGDAPKSTSIEKSRLQNPVTINVSKVQPGSPNGSAFGGIDVNMYRSDTDTDVPNPNESKSVIQGDIGNFSPLTAIIGGGDLSFRMTKTSNNITVHYVKTDLLASGPPDALFDDESSSSGSSGNLEEAWRFGSEGPEIYDHVLIGMPYNGSNHPDSNEFTMEIGKFYDDDWNVIWNASTNTTSEIPSEYDAYTDAKYKGYVDGSGITASKTDPTSTVYVNTSSNMIWMEIPHFSGVAPTISSAEPSSGTTTSTGDSGGGASLPPALSGEFTEKVTQYTMLSLSSGESGDVTMPDDSPVERLRITAKSEMLDPSITAGRHAAKPDDVDEAGGAVEKYISISASASDDEVESVDIEFSVESAWLDENGLQPGDVVLSRWHDGDWQDLETRVASEGDEVKLTAESPGFSVFAIRGETVAATPTPTPTERAAPTATPTATEAATGTPTDTPTSPGLTALPGIAGLLAALFVARTRE